MKHGKFLVQAYDITSSKLLNIKCPMYFAYYARIFTGHQVEIKRPIKTYKLKNSQCSCWLVGLAQLA